jgi:hypothetical protein
MNPRGCRQVGPGAVTMMAYPMQRMTAFKQQGDRPQIFGLCLRVSPWQYLFEPELHVMPSCTFFQSRCRNLVRCMIMHVLCCAVLCCAVLCCQSDSACATCLSLLQIGESGWAPPLPLESSDSSSQADDMNTKPVLLRAQIPEWGTVHEVVARVEMAGAGFERTMVSHCAMKS